MQFSRAVGTIRILGPLVLYFRLYSPWLWQVCFVLLHWTWFIVPVSLFILLWINIFVKTFESTFLFFFLAQNLWVYVWRVWFSQEPSWYPDRMTKTAIAKPQICRVWLYCSVNTGLCLIWVRTVAFRGATNRQPPIEYHCTKQSITQIESITSLFIHHNFFFTWRWLKRAVVKLFKYIWKLWKHPFVRHKLKLSKKHMPIGHPLTLTAQSHICSNKHYNKFHTVIWFSLVHMSFWESCFMCKTSGWFIYLF